LTPKEKESNKERESTDIKRTDGPHPPAASPQPCYARLWLRLDWSGLSLSGIAARQE